MLRALFCVKFAQGRVLPGLRLLLLQRRCREADQKTKEVPFKGHEAKAMAAVNTQALWKNRMLKAQVNAATKGQLCRGPGWFARYLCCLGKPLPQSECLLQVLWCAYDGIGPSRRYHSTLILQPGLASTLRDPVCPYQDHSG